MQPGQNQLVQLGEDQQSSLAVMPSGQPMVQSRQLVIKQSASDPFTQSQAIVSSTQVRHEHSLIAWCAQYYIYQIQGLPEKTIQAKTADLQKFIAFFQTEVGHDHLDHWTLAVSRHFLTYLKRHKIAATSQHYKATTINRILATLRSFSKWLHQQRPFLVGDPLLDIKDIKIDAPNWNGLTDRQLLRLKNACEHRLKMCTRANQDPLMETAVFYTLMQTGLRESEIVTLTVGQYHHRGLHNVMRHKSKRVSRKIHLPAEARLFLDQYLEKRQQPVMQPMTGTDTPIESELNSELSDDHASRETRGNSGIDESWGSRGGSGIKREKKLKEETGIKDQNKNDTENQHKNNTKAEIQELQQDGQNSITLHPDDPLFLNRYGRQLATHDVYRLCQRILKQSITYLNKQEHFTFSPHQLRHTFLKRTADKYGLHFAHEASGNVSIKEIFRYTKPSQQDLDHAMEQLFE